MLQPEEPEFFLKAVDDMGDVHISSLQVFEARGGLPGREAYLEVQGLYEILEARSDAQKDYVYAALDVLANKRFIIHGNVPVLEEGRIDAPRQRFALTSLGQEFLEFVRKGDLDPPTPVAASAEQ